LAVRFEMPAMPVEQAGRTFYVGRFSARSLVSIAYVQARDEGEGVQRILSAVRLKEIGAYLTSTKQPGLLPNSIILGLGNDSAFDSAKSVLRVPNEPRQAFVIDGQHRLFAFQDQYVGDDFDMDVPFSALINPPLEDIVYLFRTINSTQRKINPSLVYDLIPDLRTDWVPFVESRAQYLVQRLNDEDTSPWYRHIAMLGGRDQPITQASFVAAIKRLLRDGEVLSESYRAGDFFGQEIQYELLETYFSAIAATFPSEWLNASFIVSKNLGVSAFLNILRDMIDRIGAKRPLFDRDALALEQRDFEPYIKRVRKPFTWERRDMAKAYLGAAGIRTLTEEMKDALGVKG
jgi:DGQHR domain-containing protein